MRRGLALVLLLAACGPMSVRQAEEVCFDRARLAKHPRGEAALGVSSGGKVGGELDVTISSDWILGKDPAALYETCVMAKSGQPPSRPLYMRPDWR